MGSAADAVEASLRILRHRDLSAHELRGRLLERGFSEAACESALETLRRTGLADDQRFARARAAALADRRAGDALIRHRLVEAGIEADVIDDALAGIEDEASRARRIVERRGAGPRTARYLAGKGFSEDAVRGAVASEGADELR